MLMLIPVSLSQANDFVAKHHRHHNPLKIHKFSIGCADDGMLCGVAIVARPAAHRLDDGKTLDVARLCTDGTRNVCSLLYAAAWRAAKAMGYSKMITYTLISENGASLRAAGWRYVCDAGVLAWGGTLEKNRRQGLLLKILEKKSRLPRKKRDMKSQLRRRGRREG